MIKWSKRTSIIAAILGLATVTTLVRIGTKYSTSSSEPVVQQETFPVQTRKVKLSSFRESGTFFGTVAGIKSAVLKTNTGGPVNSIAVSAGDVVAKGTKLCDIDGDIRDLAYQGVVLAEKIKREQYHRITKHLEGGSASRVQADNGRLAWIQAKQEVLRAREDREAAYCIAPFSGMVTNVFIEPFEEIGMGQKTIALAQFDQVKISVMIPASDIDGYKVGAPVEISDQADRFPNKGSIHSIDQAVDSSARGFKIELRFENSQSVLKPGQTVQVEIQRYEVVDRIVIPSSAIVYQNNSPTVMIARNGAAKSIPIEIGTANTLESIVTSGLKVGDLLIVAGQNHVYDGAKVYTPSSEQVKSI